jgi:hypothetical protein
MSQPTIPQLTARHATLADLVEVLRGQHAAKLDVVTAARNLHAADGRLHVAGAAHELTLDGVTRTDARLLPTTAADNQIAKKLDIPPPYLRRVRENHLGLYDANVNGWLAHDPQRRFLVRGLASEGETGVMRALLSDQFRIVDNLDVLMSALDGIRQAGAQVDITSADLTETRMYVKVRSSEIAEYAPDLLANYTSPFSGARGADNPLVWAGFVISNSETGNGSFKISPQLTVEICNNGMTLTEHVLKEVHLGGRLPEGQIRWSEDTARVALDLVIKQARDAVATFLDREFVKARIAEITAAAGVEVTTPTETLEHVGKALRFTGEQQDTILNHFISGGDRTAGGVLHAVTSAAQLITNADAAYEMEAQGLRAMSLAAAHANRG